MLLSTKNKVRRINMQEKENTSKYVADISCEFRNAVETVPFENPTKSRYSSRTRIREVTLICPSCGKPETRRMGDKKIQNSIFVCLRCKIPVNIYDKNGEMICGGFPLTEEEALAMGLLGRRP